LIQNPSAVTRGTFERLRENISRQDNEKLSLLARQAGVTKETVLLACLALSVGRFAAQPCFSLNITTSYRPGRHLNTEVDHLLGEFTSAVPVECNMVSSDNFFAVLQRLQRALGDSLNHQAVSAVAVSRLAARKLGSSVVFPVVFTCATSKDMGVIEAELGAPIYAVSQTPQVVALELFYLWAHVITGVDGFPSVYQ
jgi:non-ribosomal peptide synthetase component F